MKNILFSAIALLIIYTAQAQSINEFHYDNTGGDVGEFVEIIIDNPQPADLSQYRITHYNGNGGAVITSTTLDNLSVSCVSEFCYYVWNPSSLQNDTEGLALSGPSGVIEFISYEGTLTAVGGDADGMTSTNVGVTEGSGTAIGTSISKNNLGVWETGTAETPGAPNSNLVPVKLLSFTSENHLDQSIKLNWSTASEINNDYFEIQRKAGNSPFHTIGKVQGVGTTSLEQQYSFIDRRPAAGINYYRLAQYDYDGTMEYHKVIAVQTRTTNTKVYPTVSDHYINVDLKQESKITIVNASGQSVYETTADQQMKIDIQSLHIGLYTLQIMANGSQEVHRFIKQ